MGLTRVLAACFAVLALCDAFVEFEKSRIYDEKDFLNNRKVTIQFCSGGCEIYVSIPDDSRDVARNIKINTGSKKTSITDANSKEADGRKKPFLYKGAQVTIDNDNQQMNSAPLLIWVVRQDAPYIDEVEIYDADDSYRAAAPAGLITIMNAEPFIVATTTDGPMTVSAFTAGFDGFDSADKCTRVLRQEDPSTFQDVLVAVRSPLITFFYDKHVYPDTKIALHASVDDVPTFDLTKPMFVTSPGYIGCSVKEGATGAEGGIRMKTFRSSLYDDDTKFFFKSDDAVSFILSGDVATDDDHPVTIVADGITIWNAVQAEAETAVLAKAKELTVKWTRNTADLNQYFMIRVEHDDPSIPQPTTQNANPIPTTTETPLDDECIGFDEGVCYLIGGNAQSWEDAQQICSRLKAELASMHSLQENSFIRRLAVSSGKVNGLLLGAIMSEEENVFEWADGSEWNYDNFYSEFPMHWLGECLAMDTSNTTGQWINLACSSNLPVICERK